MSSRTNQSTDADTDTDTESPTPSERRIDAMAALIASPVDSDVVVAGDDAAAALAADRLAARIDRSLARNFAERADINYEELRADLADDLLAAVIEKADPPEAVAAALDDAGLFDVERLPDDVDARGEGESESGDVAPDGGEVPAGNYKAWIEEQDATVVKLGPSYRDWIDSDDPHVKVGPDAKGWIDRDGGEGRTNAAADAGATEPDGVAVAVAQNDPSQAVTDWLASQAAASPRTNAEIDVPASPGGNSDSNRRFADRDVDEDDVPAGNYRAWRTERDG